MTEQALRRFIQRKDNEYNSGDPFFVAVCSGCAKEYWSTRRINTVCMRYGNKNARTNKPAYTIESYKNTTK